MNWLKRSLLAVAVLFSPIAVQTACAAFSSIQVGGNGNQGDAICIATTGSFTGVGGPGTCMTIPATCDGTTDDTPAFATF